MSKNSPGFQISLLAAAVSAALASAAAFAQDANPAPQSEEIDEVVVTGYRASLQSATNAKRESVGFSDSVFAEDIGKFPDLNIAESLNRIPGVQLTREVTGEGLNIAIRGLNTNFTKTTINGAAVGVASTGRVDSSGQNRELDLDLFPTELFTRLDVSKSPVASQLEGGAAGTVDMRTARPFDNPGTHFNYQLQGSYSDSSEATSPRASLMGSWTGETFGVLVGFAGVDTDSTTTGFETIGYTNPNLSWNQCGLVPAAPTNPASGSGAAGCNVGGGNGWVMPNTIPTNSGLGATTNGFNTAAGQPITPAMLLALNPGLTLAQIDKALIPRLGRPAYLDGTRDRYSGLVSLEYRPSDELNFYFDTLYSKAHREFNRLDLALIGRNGTLIPTAMEVDENNVVTSATIANAQWFLEARPYDEQVDFWGFNPGMRWQLSDSIRMDLAVNKSRSWFFREAPTILVNTPLNAGITADFDNTGGDFVNITPSADVNDPSLGWTWAGGGRVNIQNEKRLVTNEGAHLDFTFGDDAQNIKVGLAYDDMHRGISGRDNSRAWQQAVCGGGGAFIPAPGSAPGCNGQAGSAVTQANLAQYLISGPAGFINVDYDAFFAATNYHEFSDNAPIGTGAATGAANGIIDETTMGYYVELNNESEVLGKKVRYNLGGRFVDTDQFVAGPVTLNNGTTITIVQASNDTSYSQFLPSFNAALTLTDDIVLRFASSRTITRASPRDMLPNAQFSDPSAQALTVGNPALAPFLSTNIDLGGEWYTGDEGYVGLTLFQKQITGFTIGELTVVPFNSLAALGITYPTLSPTQQIAIDSRGGPNGATVNQTRQINAAGQLNIRGYEMTWVQPLNFITEGFGFQANYTSVKQSTEGGAGQPAVAVGISPVTYNATLYYDNGPGSVRLSFVHNDEQVASGTNQEGLTGARFWTDATNQLDLSASYKFESLPSSPQITLNVINITGETIRQTWGSDSQPYGNAARAFYDPGYAVLLGIRGTF
ncbi:MAG: TonB-dependent receptor [Pseudomonadota bacterium]